MRQWSAPLEASLQAEYHLSLVHDLGTPRLSWRLLGVLIRCLPPGCALHRAQDPEGAGWDVNSHLLAALIDVGQAGNWQRGGGKGNRPKPLPRPKPGGQRRRTREEQVAAYWQFRRDEQLREERQRLHGGEVNDVG